MNEQQNKPGQPQENNQLASGNSADRNTNPRQEDIENEQDTARIRTEKQSVEDGSQQEKQ